MAAAVARRRLPGRARLARPVADEDRLRRRLPPRLPRGGRTPVRAVPTARRRPVSRRPDSGGAAGLPRRRSPARLVRTTDAISPAGPADDATAPAREPAAGRRPPTRGGRTPRPAPRTAHRRPRPQGRRRDRPRPIAAVAPAPPAQARRLRPGRRGRSGVDGPHRVARLQGPGRAGPARRNPRLGRASVEDRRLAAPG